MIVNKNITLSKRECEVIEKSIEGNIVKEVAEKLCISFSTVDTHIKNAKRKTGAKNMSQLVAIYIMVNPQKHSKIIQ